MTDPKSELDRKLDYLRAQIDSPARTPADKKFLTDIRRDLLRRSAERKEIKAA